MCVCVCVHVCVYACIHTHMYVCLCVCVYVCMCVCVCVSCRHGYPDMDYLRRVQEELADDGVTEADLTNRQRDFIENPGKYIQQSFEDFSHYFNV